MGINMRGSVTRGAETRRAGGQIRQKLTVMFLLLILSAAFTFLFLGERETEAAAEELTYTALPVISVQLELEEGNIEINEMHGYTAAMDAFSMRESITPVPEDGILNFVIDTKGQAVTGAKYRMYSPEGYRVAAEGTAEHLQIDGETFSGSFDIPVSSTLSDGEYILCLMLSTQEWDCVYYYTVLDKGSLPDYGAQLAFVEQFHRFTFLTSSMDELEPYLISSGTQSGHYGTVTLGDPAESLMWGDLAPGQIGAENITITDISGDTVCSYRVDFLMETESQGETSCYNVTENFCISSEDSDISLLSYERTTEEIFEAEAERFTANRINLGIQPDGSMEYMASSNQSYIAFVNNGRLWRLSLSDYSAAKVFDFFGNESISGQAADCFQEYDIKILSLDADGSMKFLVYGYMNSGTHQGEVGIALYSYDSGSRTTTEETFISYDKSYQYLKEVIGKIAYITGEDAFYLMVEDSLYYMDFIGRESIQTVGGLTEGSYVIHPDGDVIAWNLDGQVYTADGIRILNLETGQDVLFKAEDGYTVKSVGFVGTDFVYLTAKKEYIAQDEYGNTIYPAEAIIIVGEDGEEKKRIEMEGYYLTSVSAEDGLISYEYSERDQEGETVKFTTVGSKEALTSASSKSSPALVSYISDDLKLRCYVLNLGATASVQESLTSVPVTIYNKLNNERGISSALHGEVYYYAYGKGELLGMYESAAAAVLSANDAYGYVIDSSGSIIYRRGVRQYYMYLLSSTVADGREILDAYAEGTALDLTGVTMEIALQYVGCRYPVVANTKNGWAMIVDYDSSLVGIRYLESGKKTELSRTEANKLFGDGGYIFIVNLS